MRTEGVRFKLCLGPRFISATHQEPKTDGRMVLNKKYNHFFVEMINYDINFVNLKTFHWIHSTRLHIIHMIGDKIY